MITQSLLFGMKTVGDELRQDLVPWSSNISSPALKYFGMTHELSLLSTDPKKPI